MSDTTRTAPDSAKPLAPEPTKTPVAERPIIGAAAAQPTGDSAIRPFQFHASEEDFTDFKRRIAATRWHDPDTVTDDPPGVPLAPMQNLAGYWASESDWSKVETRLNAFPTFL